MSSALITPVSYKIIGTLGFIFPHVYQGDGADEDEWVCTGFQDGTTITADQTLLLVFDIPKPLPTGVLTLQTLARADAVTGSSKFDVKWVAATPSAGDDPSSLTKVSEGVQTFTWATAEDDIYKRQELILNATTVPVASDQLLLEIIVDDTSFDLAVISGYQWGVWYDE